MHWSAATVDLLGYLPGAYEAAIIDPQAAIEKLPPDHPYHLVSPEDRRAALTLFQQSLADAGLPYLGAAEPGHNLLLPSPVGVGRPTFLAPSAQIGGRLDGGDPMLIVGFSGMRDFYPALIAENLNKQGYAARYAHLPLDVITSRLDSNTVQFAQAIDASPVHSRLGVALAKLVKPGNALDCRPFSGCTTMPG